jgi:putative SOS response-associated peptidase YedK
MCGRFTQVAPSELIAEQFQLQNPPLFQTRSNIAPSQSVAAI